MRGYIWTTYNHIVITAFARTVDEGRVQVMERMSKFRKDHGDRLADIVLDRLENEPDAVVDIFMSVDFNLSTKEDC